MKISILTQAIDELIENSNRQEIIDIFVHLGELMDRHDQLKEILVDPAMSCEYKKNILFAIIDKMGVAYPLMKRILEFLAGEEQLSLLEVLGQRLAELHDKKNNIQKATIYSASDLDNGEIERLKGCLEGDVILHNEVNPSLIAGIKIQTDNYIIDNSLGFRLEEIERALLHTK